MTSPRGSDHTPGPTVLAFERFAVEPSSSGDFERFLQELVDTVRSEPGLLWADAATAFDDQPSYLVVSEWRTAADLEAWEESQGYKELLLRADPWLRRERTRRRFGATR